MIKYIVLSSSLDTGLKLDLYGAGALAGSDRVRLAPRTPLCEVIEAKIFIVNYGLIIDLSVGGTPAGAPRHLRRHAICISGGRLEANAKRLIITIFVDIDQRVISTALHPSSLRHGVVS